MKKLQTILRPAALAAVVLLGCAGARAARIDSLSFVSPLLPEPMAVRVIVPESPADSIPTVYLLNGYGGDCTQWTTTCPELPAYADAYGMLMVLPSGMESWYVDSPVRPDMQMASFITKKLIPEIDRRYHSDPSRRAITGLSMGGHGALTLAMDNPGLFAAAGSTSGGVDLRPFTDRWGLVGLLGEPAENPLVWEKVSAVARVDSLREKAPDLRIIFDCGTDDFFAGVNDELHRRMLAAEVPHDYISRPGRHSHAYWRNSIAYHLLFFDRLFREK